MKTTFLESPVIFLSILKWLALAMCIGCIVGTSTAGFLYCLEWSIAGAQRLRFYFWLLPLALPFSSLLIDRFAPEAEGYGARVIEAIHKYSGKIPVLVPPVKFTATIITIAFGGSAGKTGPCVQIGAGLASLFATSLRLHEDDRKNLVVCAISAAFAALFGTTLAGALFGIEVLFIGALFYNVLFPAFISGLTAYKIASMLGITYPTYHFSNVPEFTGILLAKLVVSGIAFGLCALLLIESLHIGEHVCQRLPMPKPCKGMIGGGLLILLTYVCSEKYLGLGTGVINACLQGHPVFPAAFFLKMLFVTITLNFCGSGGIVTPILFIGAVSGSALGQMWGENPAFFSAIGMMSLLAGAANTPLTASVMAVELFGASIAPYATVACLTSFLMAGHRTVYPSQVLLFPKSAFLELDTNKEIRAISNLRLSSQFPSLFRMILTLFPHKKK